MFSHTLANPCMPICSLARIIGKMISCFPAMPRGRLYYRPLESRKVAALAEAKSYDGKVLLMESELFCVRWWLHNLQFSTAPIRRDNPTIVLYSDASGYGYGSFCEGEYCQGFFSEKELPLSINSKETLAVWYSILSFRSKLKNRHCLALSDNKIVISYISHTRGMQSELRDKICRDIWNFIFDNMWLSISFVPGQKNLDSDFASCQLNPATEMTIPDEVFHSVCIELNFYPSVDMMASRINNKCKKYFSFCPDPFCLGVNTFYANWNHCKMYIFSPISLNSQVMAKLEADGRTALVAIPEHRSQTWFGHLLRLVKPTGPELVDSHNLTKTSFTTFRILPSPPYLPWACGEQLDSFTNQKLLFAICSRRP